MITGILQETVRSQRPIKSTRHKKVPSRWRPFEAARSFARKLGFSNHMQWHDYVVGRKPELPPKPDDIPNRPDSVYRKSGWIHWPDWLGTSYIPDKSSYFLSYKEAKDFVQRQGIKSGDQYHAFCRKHRLIFLPFNPDRAYKTKGWTTWADFLATRRFHRIEWREFDDAREFVRCMGFRSSKEFFKWCSGKFDAPVERPYDIPPHPHIVYKSAGWIDYGDWLGTHNPSSRPKIHLPFNLAREYVRGLGLRSQHEYFIFWDTVKPGILPKSVNTVYRRSGWKNWADFLGIVRPRLEGWRPYKDAERFVHQLGLKNHGAWVAYCRGDLRHLPQKPADIPSGPYGVYAGKGWKTWGDWLGSGNIRKWAPSFVSYHEARTFARKLGLKSGMQWKAYIAGKYPDKPKKPESIPSVPERIYKEVGWTDWKDFLGTEGRHRRKPSSS